MDRFLEKFNLPRLNQEEIEIMNNPITSTEIEAVIKKLPQKQKPRIRQLHRRILSNIQRRANAYPKLFQKIAEEGILPNSFYESTITLIPKPDKDNTQKRKLQANITDEHRCKNPQQNFIPGGPVAKTACFQCRRPGLDPWAGNQTPHGTTKSPQGTTKTRSSQINIKNKKSHNF